MPPEANDIRGWNGLGGLDKLLDHRVRLAICVLASRYRQLTFTRLKELLEETDGSLGAHLRKLEDSGYLQVDKEFKGRKPVSAYTLTRAGRKALDTHVSSLTELLRQTRKKR